MPPPPPAAACITWHRPRQARVCAACEPSHSECAAADALTIDPSLAPDQSRYDATVRARAPPSRSPPPLQPGCKQALLCCVLEGCWRAQPQCPVMSSTVPREQHGQPCPRGSPHARLRPAAATRTKT
jgi:hypothetical protein